MKLFILCFFQAFCVSVAQTALTLLAMAIKCQHKKQGGTNEAPDEVYLQLLQNIIHFFTSKPQEFFIFKTLVYLRIGAGHFLVWLMVKYQPFLLLIHLREISLRGRFNDELMEGELYLWLGSGVESVSYGVKVGVFKSASTVS